MSVHPSAPRAHRPWPLARRDVARSVLRWLAVVAITVAVVVLAARSVRAACNLIPVAKKTFPAVLGSIRSPISAPGETIELRLNLLCDSSAGFQEPAGSNAVTITFEPPGGPMTDVVIDAGTLAVDECSGGRCNVLTFAMPDTSGLLPPHGLAGPARIVVRDGSSTRVAEVGQIFLPTFACSREPEPVFGQFTILPLANVFAEVAAGATDVLATVDGGNNLLVPFDYWGGGVNSVLAETPGAPVAIFLEGTADFPALGAGDSQTLTQVLAAQPSPSDLLRSFTLDGRPLPPLLRVSDSGKLFGTADAVASVLRVAKNDGKGGPDLYDVTDRLEGGRGPIVITSFAAAVNDPLPLKSLQSSEETVAYARDESRELMSLNTASGDVDENDLVVQVVDAQAGTQSLTGRAVTEVPSGAFIAPALVTFGGFAAFLESELGQNDTDINTDGDTADNLLRVFDSAGIDRASAFDIDAAIGLHVSGRSLDVSGDRVFFRHPGAVVEQLVNGEGGVSGLLDGPMDAALSPDGAHLYVASQGGFSTGSVVVFSRDAASGELTFVEAELEGVHGVTGIEDAEGVAVSPLGDHVYVIGQATPASVAVFSRSPSTGELAFVEAQFDGLAGVTGLDGQGNIVVSADGAHVYATGDTADAVVVFDRNPLTGGLTFVEAETNGVAGVSGIDKAWGIDISPDGLYVYVAGRASGAIAVFSRNTASGELTWIDAVFDGVAGVEGLSNPQHVAVSPDGEHLYAASGTDRAVAVFERDQVSGALSFVRAYFDGEDGITGLNSVVGLRIGADGTRLYTSGLIGPGVVVSFRRNPATGELAFLEVLQTNVAGVPSFATTFRVAVSPDDAHVYVPSWGVSGRVTALRTRALLGVLDAKTETLLGPEPAANLVAVAEERAAVLTPEAVEGVDLNADSDLFDEVAQLYDASKATPKLTSLGVAANRVAISGQIVAVTIPERSENQPDPAGRDLNGDGDTDDDVVAVVEIGKALVPDNLGVSADAIGASGTALALISAEAAEGELTKDCAPTVPAGGCDLNGDADSNDRVLRVYEQSTDTLTNVGQPAEEFVLEGSLVAFRTREASHGEFGVGCGVTTPPGGCDLNDDGDAADSVMQVYDLARGELINTRFAAIPCGLPGCDPILPYKINGSTVSFLTDEQEQGATDLNGDGDADDIVLTVFDVHSRAPQAIGAVVDDQSGPLPNTPEITPLPTADIGGGSVVFIEVKETQVGEDINEDGTIDGAVVVMLAGDVDEDGTFDAFDSCVEGANSSQLDIDGDGLGDAACDPNPVICSVTPLTGCLETTAAGKALVQVKDKSADSKDSLLWKWKPGEATALGDFGDPTGTAPVYSLCVYDASTGGALLVDSAIRPGGSCGKKPCWKRAGKKGFKHRNKGGVPGGIERMKMKSGGSGKASIVLKGRGAALELPGLPWVTPVTVQLVVNEVARQQCWQAIFSSPIKNQAGSFKAKGD